MKTIIAAPNLLKIEKISFWPNRREAARAYCRLSQLPSCWAIEKAGRGGLIQSAKIKSVVFCPFADIVGEFPKQRTYAFHPTQFKELTQLKLNSPTVSTSRQNRFCANRSRDSYFNFC